MRRSQSVREKSSNKSPGPLIRRRQSERVRHSSADSAEGKSSFAFPWGSSDNGSLHKSKRGEHRRTGSLNRSTEDKRNSGIFDSFRGMTYGGDQREKQQQQQQQRQQKEHQSPSFMGMFRPQNQNEKHEHKHGSDRQQGWKVFNRDSSREQENSNSSNSFGGQGIKSMFKGDTHEKSSDSSCSSKGLLQKHSELPGRKSSHGQKEMTQDRRRSRKGPKQQSTVDFSDIQDKLSGFFSGFGKQ